MGATATLKSAFQTIYAAGGTPAAWETHGMIDGRVKCMIDSYTAVGSGEDAGSVITFPALPVGANIIAMMLTGDTSTSGLTLSVGDADSATRYGSALTSLQTAGVYTLANGGTLPRVVGTSTNDNKIILTTGGAALTSGAKYGMIVLYSFD